MSRVNKVILAPVAVMADGGAICNSGHMMVANAAKVSGTLLCYSEAMYVRWCCIFQLLFG